MTALLTVAITPMCAAILLTTVAIVAVHVAVLKVSGR